MITSFRSTWYYTASLWCLVVLALSVCLGLSHWLAFHKSQLQAAFALVNSRTIHNIQLITFVDSHREWASAYMLLLLTALVFCSWRRYPTSASWMCFVLLGAPCIVYFRVCSYIIGKLLALG